MMKHLLVSFLFVIVPLSRSDAQTSRSPAAPRAAVVSPQSLTPAAEKALRAIAGRRASGPVDAELLKKEIAGSPALQGASMEYLIGMAAAMIKEDAGRQLQQLAAKLAALKKQKEDILKKIGSSDKVKIDSAIAATEKLRNITDIRFKSAGALLEKYPARSSPGK